MYEWEGHGGRQDGNLYPECGCSPEYPNAAGGVGIWNFVCRNADCLNYGAHVRGLGDDSCAWCSTPLTLLSADPFKGAR